MESNTLLMVSAGDHCCLRMSRPVGAHVLQKKSFVFFKNEETSAKITKNQRGKLKTSNNVGAACAMKKRFVCTGTYKCLRWVQCWGDISG